MVNLFFIFRQELWTEIERRFVLEGERPLRIIGHSLGGALASLAALDFYLNFKPVGTSLESMTVRTFGCPCVGNQPFVDLYNDSIKGQGSTDVRIPTPLGNHPKQGLRS